MVEIAPPSLTLFNSLTRGMETFTPIHAGEARVYSCGPTVYHYAHIGNMRAYVFADILGRTLSHFGYVLTHVINITDVGHLTDDADAGEDKLERAAAGGSIWDIAGHYTDAFKADATALNIRPPAQWSVASDYVPAMIDFARGIASEHCYELPAGLYFDTSTVAGYGQLARAPGGQGLGDGEGRIDPVAGKRHPADFAIWRRTPPGERRQMEWDSPWGRGAPGWHLECSVMSGALLGFPFDIHTGGIDHREIHHPNEIAQNQAHCHSADSGAKLWMHNNFLVERAGKMSKSSGEFLRLQVLVDRGYHPLALRLLCLQAHYRSELEFGWDGLNAALTRLKRLVMAVETLRGATPPSHAELGSASIAPPTPALQGEGEAADPRLTPLLARFDAAVADDLNTAVALTALEELLALKQCDPAARLAAVAAIDAVLGLDLPSLSRADLRLRPTTATITEAEIEAVIARRQAARAAKDYASSDALRDRLAAHGVEIMDGDPLGWDWRLV